MGETRGFNPMDLLKKAGEDEHERSTEAKLDELNKLRGAEVELSRKEKTNIGEGKPVLPETTQAFDASTKRAGELAGDKDVLSKLQTDATKEDEMVENYRSEKEFYAGQEEQRQKEREEE